MRRYSKIVVASLLDDNDRNTLRHVAHFAKAAHSKSVHLAHVLETLDTDYGQLEGLEGLEASNRDAAETRLEELLEESRKLLPESTRVESALLGGSPVLELAKHAMELQSDLIAMTAPTHGELDTARDLALKLLRKVPCSMFVLPEDVAPSYRRILVPVDFSSNSREALDVALAVASTVPESSVVALHAYSVPIGYHKTGHSHETVAARMRKLGEERWEELRAEIDTRDVSLSARFELGTHAEETILGVSEKEDFDLVVMASHGQTRPAALLLGHTPEIVCARTRRPFLCVKRRGEVIGLLEALLRFLSLKGE